MAATRSKQHAVIHLNYYAFILCLLFFDNKRRSIYVLIVLFCIFDKSWVMMRVFLNCLH